jgi:ribosome biogenesis GTPase A
LHTLLTIEDCRAVNIGLREKLLPLERKLASNQLHLAVLVQMKRGKSSFINALLGAELLPIGVVPVTAEITEIKYAPVPPATILRTTGQREEVVIRHPGGLHHKSWQPRQQSQVASVEMTYPSPFLASGIILIDTPGHRVHAR